MAVTHAPGWSGEWLNGWLAAIGVTMLDVPVPGDSSGLRLSWTDGPDPYALLHHPDGTDVAALIAVALPTVDQLNRLSIAPGRSDGPDLSQTPRPREYARRAAVARDLKDGYLETLATDLAPAERKSGKDPVLARGAFNPMGPNKVRVVGGARIARERLDKAAKQRARADSLTRATALARLVAESASGHGRLTDGGGTGFDIRRFTTGVSGDSRKLVDPIVELLAFVALPLFPVRGDGRRALTRGWSDQWSKRGAFVWPTWRDPLDRWAIDALLDRHPRARTASQRQRLGIGSRYAVQPFFEGRADERRRTRSSGSSNLGYDSAPA